MLMAAIMCFSVFGCSNQSPSQATVNNTSTVSSESASNSVLEKTDKNVFYLSDTTDKEEFYLNAVSGSDY